MFLASQERGISLVSIVTVTGAHQLFLKSGMSGPARAFVELTKKDTRRYFVIDGMMLDGGIDLNEVQRWRSGVRCGVVYWSNMEALGVKILAVMGRVVV